MLVAEDISTLDGASRHHRSRRRSRRSRFMRNFRRSWRRTRLRRTVISLVLAVAAVIGGYRVSMYVANQDVPSPEELGVENRHH
jgi:hypothetical protein